MPSDSLARKVRLAGRAAARAGLVTAFGHVSARIDEHSFLVSSARPLGTLGIDDPGVIVPLIGDLPAGALPEVRLHREIYRVRPDVGGVCRTMPPSVVALSTLGRTARALHGAGSYFAPGAPLWPDPQLVRDDERAVAIAQLLGSVPAIVMRGNGVVTAGTSIEEALAYAVYLEEASRIELAVLPHSETGRGPIEFSPDEAARRATHAGGLIDRMWQYLCFGDPEWEPMN